MTDWMMMKHMNDVVVVLLCWIVNNVGKTNLEPNMIIKPAHHRAHSKQPSFQLIEENVGLESPVLWEIRSRHTQQHSTTLANSLLNWDGGWQAREAILQRSKTLREHWCANSAFPTTPFAIHSSLLSSLFMPLSHRIHGMPFVPQCSH